MEPITRRRFLEGSLAATVVVGGAWVTRWDPAVAAPTVPGPSPYGPLLDTPDANGLLLPAGFTSRVVMQSAVPIGATAVLGHPFPDGAATFPTSDGGWLLVSNSENPPPAADLPGVSPALDGLARVTVIRFAADGAIVDAYRALDARDGAQSLCAGGPTPWGTWLACEEFESPASPLSPYRGGRVFECDPTGQDAPVLRPAMGAFKHEMATCDPDEQRIYLSEDQADGLLYRFTPTTWGDLSSGSLDAALVGADGAVTWVAVPDPTGGAGALREQVSATAFDGGEGLAYGEGVVYLATKGDDRVWAYRTADQVIEVLYDAADSASPILTGVDNLHVSPRTGEVYVAEDGGNMEVCVITPAATVYTFCRLTGPQHGADNPTPLPTASEVTGVAFSPDGTRLYLGSQRGFGTGIVYEVTGPFLDAPPGPTTTTTTTSTSTSTTPSPSTSTTPTPPTPSTSSPTSVPATDPPAPGTADVTASAPGLVGGTGSGGSGAGSAGGDSTGSGDSLARTGVGLLGTAAAGLWAVATGAVAVAARRRLEGPPPEVDGGDPPRGSLRYRRRS